MTILAGSALAGRLSVYLNVHIQTMNAISIHIDLNTLGPGNSTTEINPSPFPELFYALQLNIRLTWPLLKSHQTGLDRVRHLQVYSTLVSAEKDNI